jgi:hypothetical protein
MRPTANQMQTESRPQEVDADNHIATLTTLLKNMPGGEAIAKSLLHVLECEMAVASAELDLQVA